MPEFKEWRNQLLIPQGMYAGLVRPGSIGWLFIHPMPLALMRLNPPTHFVLFSFMGVPFAF